MVVLSDEGFEADVSTNQPYDDTLQVLNSGIKNNPLLHLVTLSDWISEFDRDGDYENTGSIY